MPHHNQISHAIPQGSRLAKPLPETNRHHQRNSFPFAIEAMMKLQQEIFLQLLSIFIDLYCHIGTDDGTESTTRTGLGLVRAGDPDPPVVLLLGQLNVAFRTGPDA
jgi:hypothetical protein